MRAGSGTTGGTGRRWLVAALAASVLLVSGCTSVDPDELPGRYRSATTGGEILLGPDGRFTATRVETDEHSGPADFHGRWEFLGGRSGSDFVYLTVEDGGLGRTAGIQLHPRGQDALEFRPDPDGKPLPEFTKVPAP
ncbi:hypothetical protein ACYTFC_12450 [Streptomyces globosus]|nr:hypothetical protein EF903_23950 [Streptomyces sp. WAC05292]